MKHKRFVFGILAYVMKQCSVNSPNGETSKEAVVTILNASLDRAAPNFKGL